ncbi:MAG TPA: hypothetical protein VF207_05820 [Chthoniobacterales bacterium]
MRDQSRTSIGDSFKPAFIVGVTGHMDLDPTHRERIKAEIKRIFAWLRAPSRTRDKNKGDPTLGPGLDLKNTPIILLSSLAPGADQWVVGAAREMDPPIRALAPLPFLKDQYLEASTFKQDGVAKDEAASKFLAEFPEEDVFVVRLLDEIDLDDRALRAKHKFMLVGPAGKQERDRRYAAAGEYVAAYSDILIAVTDKPIGQAESAIVNPGEDSGARAIAELKRRGLTPGLLPVLPALSWADNGPVIHIYAPRKRKEVCGRGEKPSGAETEPLEVLYPYDCRPPGVSENEHDNPAWHKAGRAILKAVAKNLERLNSEKIRIEPAREDGAFAEMLPASSDSSAGPSRNHALSTANEHLKANLDRLARLRRRVADYGAHYNAHLTVLKRALFSLAFCSAFFFSLADNWNVNDGMLSLPQIFFVTAFGLTLATWIVYLCFKKTAAAERSDDYRAIAEGLRVQFYWTASGSGEAVASNYLQRQRGELGWIRKVISVAAFPYEPNRVQFNQLSLDAKLAALQSIRKAWISGQYAYFKDKIDDLSLRREVFSTYAQVLLWTGFVLFAFLVFFAQRTEFPALPRLIAFLCFGAGSLIFAILYRETCARKRARDSGPVTKNEGRIQEKKNRRPKPSISGFREWLFSVPKMFLPERIQSRKGGDLILNSLLVGALTLLIVGTAYLLEGIVPWLPPANKVATIFKYLALAGGALCGAWVEANFFAENIRQYASMAALFQAAGLRFDDYFDWPAQAGMDQKEAIEKQVVANIQSLIVAVGREALSENAEWLITHRLRPLEPVSV